VHQHSRWPHWFGYGSVQLLVCSCRLVNLIIVPARHTPCEIPGARAGELHVVAPMTYGEIVPAIEAAGSRWEPRDFAGLPEQRTVVTSADRGRVSFVFATADDHGVSAADPMLDKIVASARPHDCPPVPAGQQDDGYGA
jgi:hypothetical protein